MLRCSSILWITKYGDVPTLGKSYEESRYREFEGLALDR